MFIGKSSSLHMIYRQNIYLFFKQYYATRIKNCWREGFDWLSIQYEVIPAGDLLEPSNSSDNLLEELEWKMGKIENELLHINTYINLYQ